MARKSELKAARPLDVFEAFRQVVLSGDVPELAAHLGYRPGTLYNKADAGDEAHNQPTLRDVVLVTRLRGDLRIVEALARMFGRATFDAAEHANVSDQDLLTLLAHMGAENGQFHAALATGLQQRRFTRLVLQQIHAEGMDIVSALMTLLHRLEAYVDDACEGPGRV